MANEAVQSSAPPTKLQLMLEKRADTVRTGGKGSMRRKKKAPHKTNAADDKKLQASLKKLGVAPIGEIEEVNLFMENQTVLQFNKPKVQASIPSNTYVVTGNPVTKDVKDILPQVLNQMGTQNLEQLKELQAQLSQNAAVTAASAEGDEIPQDDENFDEAN
eukprot:NODE_2301_length_601_cov_65.145570_g2251_i0.p1 GENE.NODE_2301_length_601_cov_65.145570_g2251_i0~~NODE_2301_length_601_cov_65.145570_g2251_i0.p1  ORF type:complete len:161 (-),score=50.76 NODE_2301_length_601_cov_65.145570_g2251_i0:47-529(-)